MDPKAAAKSKRSQSQQGKRNHPTPSAAIAHKKKEPLPPSKQPEHGGAQRSRRHRHHNLPSNWDRYGDDDDDAVVGAEEGASSLVRRDAGEPAAKVTQPLGGGGDAVAPKSKGADFGYLIEQARSQPRDRGYGDGGLGSSSLSDETVPDFVQDLVSIISVKGESLLSWCSNDNFTVDNDPDAGSSFEVPFLSMDVHAVAAQLSKLNMAQRLFIEEDILPSELRVDRLNENSVQRFDHVETQNSGDGKHCLADDAFPGAEDERVAVGQSKPSQSKAVEGQDSMQRSGKEVSPLFSLGQGKKEDLINPFESLEWERERQSGESGSNADMNTIQDSASKFEASAAEEELDSLLDSFVVTNEFASSGLGSSTFVTNNALHHLVHMGAVSSRREGSSSSKAGAGLPFEDTISEILAESHASCSPGMFEDFSNGLSTPLKPCDLSTEMGAGSSRPGFRDSRPIVPLETSIDDLLAETSFFYSSGIDGQSDGALAQDRPHWSAVRVDAPHPREDHDSRRAASTISLDETIDDLLETSSEVKNQKPSPHPQVIAHTNDKPTISKALDDFDTWLDSI